MFRNKEGSLMLLINRLKMELLFRIAQAPQTITLRPERVLRTIVTK
jgi:hypothetical protein